MAFGGAFWFGGSASSTPTIALTIALHRWRP
jgi:hypothetical protein